MKMKSFSKSFKSAALPLGIIALLLIQGLGLVTKVVARLTGRASVTRTSIAEGDTPIGKDGGHIV